MFPFLETFRKLFVGISWVRITCEIYQGTCDYNYDRQTQIKKNLHLLYCYINNLIIIKSRSMFKAPNLTLTYARSSGFYQPVPAHQ